MLIPGDRIQVWANGAWQWRTVAERAWQDGKGIWHCTLNTGTLHCTVLPKPHQYAQWCYDSSRTKIGRVLNGTGKHRSK